MPDHISITKHFNYAYKNLSSFERITLQVCSVIYDFASTSTILHCLFRTGIRTEISPQAYPRLIETAFSKLKELGLLEPSWRCSRPYVELATRQSIIERNFPRIVRAVLSEQPTQKTTFQKRQSTESHLNDLRITLYSNNIEQFHQHLVQLLEDKSNKKLPIHPMVTICNTPFSPAWFSTLPVHIQFHALHEIIKHSILNLEPLDIHIRYLRGEDGHCPKDLLSYSSFLYLLISAHLLRGEVGKARDLILQHGDELQSLGLKGWLKLIEGSNTEAIQFFHADLESLRKQNNQNDAYFTGFEGILYCLALMKTENTAGHEEVRNICKAVKPGPHSNIFSHSYSLINNYTESKLNRQLNIIQTAAYDAKVLNSTEVLIQALITYWEKGRLSIELEQQVNIHFNKAVESDYTWLAMEYAELLSRMSQQQASKNFAEEFRRKNCIISLADMVEHQETWKIALQELNQLTSQLAKGEEAGARRLAWMIDTSVVAAIQITPKEQRLTSNGSWSSGRTISAKRLFHQENIDYLTEQDKKVCAFIDRITTASGEIDYVFDIKASLHSLADHRHVFLVGAPHIHVEIKKGEPEIRVNESGDQIELKFFPPVRKEKFIILPENPTSLKIISVEEEHRKIADIIGERGLSIPQKAKKQVMTTIGKVAAHLNVFSDIGGFTTVHLKTTPDSRIHLQLLPSGHGIRINMFVRPFNTQGPYFKPGSGPVTIFSEINGQLVQTERDLAQEDNNGILVEERCPILNLCETGSREWVIPEPTDCLELLYNLKNIDTVVIEWPKGEKMKIKHSSGPEQCHLRIKRNNTWFEVDGYLAIDDSKVLKMEQLLKAVRKSRSRFIELEDGEFLALTEKLYATIEKLDLASSEEHDQIRISPLSVHCFSEMTKSGIDVRADRNWHTQLIKINTAITLVPNLPSTLQAELRDYQIKGFNWMMRLAHWGAGACLADDMGLGKTIQALAVILAHAATGPSLVIAPTSVCPNWQEEAQRFAPTLKIAILSSIDQRHQQINGLAAFDLLIISYGILQQEPELLASKEWQIIVLDEGQAIKNSNTKRSAAVMKLNGIFKIITTGTPIENNLGELWNLFRFINPGLLGSKKRFNRQFANPIERDKNRSKKTRLKKLISPFILRRLKSQVLEELPPRTEVNLFVDLTEDENIFYEALRRQSVEKINTATPNLGNRHIRILAEIMKLRRACCNPRLVHPESTLESSKLTLFKQTITELLANRHKTLVFSQFVDHLAIIREFFDEIGIKYHYLDGSTPTHKRKSQVDAFQAGDSDVFLISLKAGGLGLNLTAANYVIHMDPWWNPAVEDQASDRAHRMGQTQAVTVYRIITRNTIEEKIVALHHEKRTLASNLLEGTDMSHKISEEDLMLLLHDI